MARPLEELEREAMVLSHEERARLAHKLIVSLDEDTSENVDDYWRGELVRRNREIESGAASLISGDEAMQKAREALKPR